MLEKVTEKFNELADLLRVKFNEETSETVEAATEESTEEATIEFAEATLTDGTTISYEGNLEPGTAVFVVMDGEQMPAPEGTHALGGDFEGVSIVVNAEGVITEVIDERGEESQDEAMSSEDINALIDSKLEGLATSMETIANGLSKILENEESFSTQIEELNKAFEEFKALPSVEKEKEQKFSRGTDLTPRQRQILKTRKSNKK